MAAHYSLFVVVVVVVVLLLLLVHVVTSPSGNAYIGRDISRRNDKFQQATGDN